MKIRDVLSEIFFPKGIKCLACNNEVFEASEHCLCKQCSLEQNKNFCRSCGRHIPDMAEFCDYCKEKPCEFTLARAPFVYNDTAQKLVHRLKYGNARYIAEVFAGYLVQRFGQLGWSIDEITFVPMHKKRLKKRGYNQAELIAKHFAHATNLPLVGYLERIKYTRNLARMSRAQRQLAIAGSIATFANVKKCAPSILLIDDVFTTSSTSSECAKQLKKNGAKAVYVLTFATSTITPMLY